MLSLPFITPRNSHELWFGPQTHHQDTHHNSPTPHHPQRRNQNHRTFLPSRSPSNSLSALAIEERALRLRKQNIASFGYSWIKPAGCAKTMLGMKEEEAEREEAERAAQQSDLAGGGILDDDMNMTAEGEEGEDVEGEGEGMERNLDDDIPEAEGLVEDGDGEGGFGEDEDEGYLERDLDDDIPEGFDHYDDGSIDGDEDGEGSLGLYEEEVEEDFDNQPDLDADVPSADGDGDGAGFGFGYGSEGDRDLDDEIPDAAEDGSEQEGEWQHTDTEDEDEEDDDEEEGGAGQQQGSLRPPRFGGNFRTSTPNSRGGLLPPMRRERETDAQTRFINRWSGGGDAFDSSSLMLEDDDLRASVTSQGSRRSGFGRRFPRHVGGPRDSLT